MPSVIFILVYFEIRKSVFFFLFFFQDVDFAECKNYRHYPGGKKINRLKLLVLRFYIRWENIRAVAWRHSNLIKHRCLSVSLETLTAKVPRRCTLSNAINDSG